MFENIHWLTLICGIIGAITGEKIVAYLKRRDQKKAQDDLGKFYCDYCSLRLESPNREYIMRAAKLHLKESHGYETGVNLDK
jgi:hypothetical protein